MPKTSIAIVIAISTLFFLVSAFILKGSLNHKETLGSELNAPVEALYHYNISKKVPFKHRILFPTIVKTTYVALKEKEDSQLFYNIYLFWSAFFYIGAALSFFILLKVLNFENVYSWIGILIYLISPAVLSAYAYPVHTREDMLGYMLVNLCLIFILKNQFWGIYLFSILGAFCRETLMLFPLIYFIYVDSRKGFYVLLSCIIIFLVLRFGMGENGYELLESGLIYNIRTIGEAMGFLFLVFSFMWIPFLYDIRKTYNLMEKLLSERISLFRKSSLLALLLVTVTTFIGGRFNEIRLMFILFPWVIPIFLYYVRANKTLVLATVKTTQFKWYALAGGIFFITVEIILNTNLYFFFDNPNLYLKFPHTQWLVLGGVYFYICYLCLPFYWMVAKRGGDVLVDSR